MNDRKSFPKCCRKCGRWGNRSFFEVFETADGRWECMNDAACYRRRIKADTGMYPNANDRRLR